MLDYLSQYLMSLFPAGFSPADMLHTLIYIVAIVFVIAVLIRLVHKKASQYNHALSSAMALMFMYLLMIQLHKLVPEIVDPVLAKLPLIDVDLSSEVIWLWEFKQMAFPDLCLELMYTFILSFCLIGLDDLIPDAKNTGSWVMLQFIIVCLAMAIYSFIYDSLHMFMPNLLTSVAPMIIVCILVFMVFLGLMKVILTLVLAAVNPLLGAISAFFSSNKFGMSLGKSAMCSFVLAAVSFFLQYKEIIFFGFAEMTLLVCLLPMAVLLMLWVVIGHLL